MKEKQNIPVWFVKSDTIFTKIVKAISAFGAVALFIIAPAATANVVTAKLLSRPISNVTELVTYMYCFRNHLRISDL